MMFKLWDMNQVTLPEILPKQKTTKTKFIENLNEIRKMVV